MGDFSQNGSVATLHNFGTRTLEELEADLKLFSGYRPMELILPSLYSELEGPALQHIVDEISQVDYLSHVIIGLDRANREQYDYAYSFFKKLNKPFSLLWNDGPRLREIQEELAGKNLAPTEPGKGRNVWYCIGFAHARGKAEAVALHDCDILTYDRGLLARLFYPIANPNYQFEFCKGFYARVADGKMNGRVSRLLVAPLLLAMERVLGSSDYLSFMKSFRYPLAGEFSFRRSLIPELRIPSDWGLEVGILSEMQRNQASNRICQVDIADNYDHKHQDLLETDRSAGLSRMSIDISKVLIRKLATKGYVFGPETFRTIKATYFRMALDMVHFYQTDAELNGLAYDIDTEERAVELFAENIMRAGDDFSYSPMETPFIPSWTRVFSAMPDIGYRLRRAVEADNQELS
ncbi:MAG: glycosyl transferase [Alphaproteobacteria bacterium]|jgi:glucosyl-3-phosphoglycerate synthase|nr:glycosyl transferase [Alphaproteobacteria bacterium]